MAYPQCNSMVWVSDTAHAFEAVSYYCWLKQYMVFGNTECEFLSVMLCRNLRRLKTGDLPASTG